MICSLSDLRNKEVISIRDGSRLGFIDDAEFDTEKASIRSFVIYGRPKFFGFFGREDDVVIKCSEIEVIGEDTVLVRMAVRSKVTKKSENCLENLFG